mgnify:CR=1 FL=1
MTRQINSLRKQVKLTIEDVIVLYIKTDDKVLLGAINDYKNELMKATLANDLVENKSNFDFIENMKVNDSNVEIGIRKID